MPRNDAVIRQWSILLELDGTRHGVSVDRLAEKTGVGKRTIWRDMRALQDVGFPLTSTVRDDSRTYWALLSMPLKAVHEPGLSLTEVCSLHMCRALLQTMPGAAFTDGLTGLMRKIDRTLSPRMRQFLEQLPGIITVKPAARKKHQANYNEIVARLIEATSGHRVSRMRYFSVSSDREKDYVIHPYNLAFSEGGLYVNAWVPEYRQIRVFAVERIRTFATTADTFVARIDPGSSPFADSLGVSRNRAERVVIEFAARVAPYIVEREWHDSQRVETLASGSVRLTLEVSRDWALRSWILGFGPHARVVSPSSLASEVLEQLAEAREVYAPRLVLEAGPPVGTRAAQPALPIRKAPMARAQPRRSAS